MSYGRQLVVLALIACASIVSFSCARKLTPEQVEQGLLALEKQSPLNQSPLRPWVASFQCSYGERDWEYICMARYEPTPLGISRGHKLLVQKQGIRNAFLYEGKLGGSISVLPDSGPTPSSAELRVITQQEYEALKKKNSGR